MFYGLAKVTIFLVSILVFIDLYSNSASRTVAKVAGKSVSKKLADAPKPKQDAKKPGERSPVKIISAKTLYGFKIPCPIVDSVSADSRCEMEAFSGDVYMRKGKNNLRADSVLVNRTQKTMQAYGNVHFWDDSMQVFSEYLRYDGKAKTILFQRSVHAIRDKQQLFSEELFYKRQENTIDYYTGGHIISDSMNIYSKEGTYFGKNKTMKLRHQVYVKDTNFRLYSDSLLYLKEKQQICFIAPTQLQQDSGTIYTNQGHYLSKSGILHLVNKPVMVNKATIYTADTIDYEKLSGKGEARRNFSFYDSAQRISINSHRAFFNTKTKYFKASDHPFMIQIKRNKNQAPKPSDSLFLRADTIVSFLTDLRKLDSAKKARIRAQKIQDSLNAAQAKAQEEVLQNALKTPNSKHGRGHNDISDNLSPFRIKKNLHNYLAPLPKELDFGSNLLLHKKNGQSVQKNLAREQDSTKVGKNIDILAPKTPNSIPKLKANLPNSEASLELENQNIIAVDKKQEDSLKNKGLQRDSVGGLGFDSSQKMNLDSLKMDSLRRDSLLRDSLLRDSLLKVEDSGKSFRVIIAYNHVRLFRDSIQSLADSMYYLGHDSILSSYGKPILWNAEKSQFSADTMRYLFRKKQLKFVEGYGNSFTIRYNKKDFYDQVASKDLRVFLDSNKVKRSLSIDSVNSITYLFDEKEQDRVSSVNVVKSDSLWAFYGKNRPEKVVYLRNIKGISYPLRALPASEKFLPNFKWQIDSSYRPRSKFDIFDTAIFRNLHILSEQDFPKYVRKNPSYNFENDSLFRKRANPKLANRKGHSQRVPKPQKEVPKSDPRGTVDRVRIIPPSNPKFSPNTRAVPKIP